MTPLQKLVLDRMREQHWTPAQVEARGISHATLHRYMQPVKLLTLPRPDTLRRLAVALDLPTQTVREAAWQTLNN